MNYYEHHLGDWLKKTAHLSALQEGIYRRLIDQYYIREAPLPGDFEACCRLARASGRHEKSAVRATLDEFFPLIQGAHHNARADEEIARFRAKKPETEAKKEAAAERTRKSRERRAAAFAALAAANVVPDFNASADVLRELMLRHGVTLPVTRYDTALQSPVTSPHINTHHPTGDSPSPGDEPSVDLLGHQLNGHAPKTVPDCPHADILAAWAEVMPDMPQPDPALWAGSTRAANLRARWRATAALKGWASKDDGLRYFRKLFAYCRGSDFLMGKAQSRERRPFELKLAWLVNATNWTKVHEGDFHG